MHINTTFKHSQGYSFNRVYTSKRGFSLGVSRGKHCTFQHAVVSPGCIVLHNLEEVRQFLKGKKK